MKKKKLKKKIKKLERTVDWHTDSQRLLALKFSRLDNEIKKLKEKSCDTCDYPVLSRCGFQCVGCPANKKEDKTNGN